MLADIRFAWKIIKYGMKVKTQCAFALLFLIIGFTIEVFSKAGTVLGGFYIVLSAVFVMQLVMSLDMSNWVQTSPYKKKLQTKLPILVCIPTFTFSYLLDAAIRLYFLHFDSAVAQDIQMQIQIKSSFADIIGMLFLTNIYFGICYKYFVLGLLSLIIFMVPALILLQTRHVFEWLINVPFGGIFAIGYFLILFSLYLAFLLTKCFYKKVLSKYAFGTALNRELR